MLRDVRIGERPHDSSAGPASLQVLGETNAFIHKHFWLTVNFPAIAPGTPGCPLPPSPPAEHLPSLQRHTRLALHPGTPHTPPPVPIPLYPMDGFIQAFMRTTFHGPLRRPHLLQSHSIGAIVHTHLCLNCF